MSIGHNARELRERLSGPVIEVAPTLLGAALNKGPVSVRITEVEAYAGSDDPGSHAYAGPTPRCQVMFGPPGHLYCYLSHGIHVCANVVVGEAGTASGVLLRAGQIVEGEAIARDRRKGASPRDLARGPGRLGRALGIELSDRGAPLIRGGAITLQLSKIRPDAVRRGPRTGLRQAPDRPWRFWIADEPTVSPYRRHPRAEAE